jgi:hypothetical protein
MKNTIKTLLLISLAYFTNSAYAQFTTTAGNISQTTVGNVAVGSPSYTPVALLQVKNGSVLFDGGTGTTPTSGAGGRLMWIPAKRAFRAGFANGTEWDDANIGTSSIAMGYMCSASGVKAISLGISTTASATNSFAIGSSTTASGQFSFAGGYGAISSATYANAFGRSVTANSFSSFVIGQFNSSGTYNATTWIATDPLFVVGNGTSTVATSNALTVLKNGNTGIGTTLTTNTNNYKLTVAASSTGTNSGILVQTAAGSLYGIKQEVNDNTTKAFVIENAGIENFKVLGDGKVYAREVNVLLGTFPDYVFDKNYKLMDLNELEIYINNNKHLPEIPSEQEVTANGANIGEMVKLQMQKIEELTLYLIEQNKKIEQLEIQNNELNNKIENLNK